MSAYLKSAPASVPGSITRVDDSTVEPAMLQPLASVYAQAYGAPMKYVTGGIAQFAVGDTAASLAGFLVKEVPTISGNTNSGFADDIPNPQQVAGLLTRGYMGVVCTIGTPVRGGTVYVRVIAASGKFVGDLEATADGSNNVALSSTQATWASDGKDAYNNAEIRVAR